MRRCLLVDFDGTLTRRDTTRLLIQSLLRFRPWLFLFVIYGYFRLLIANGDSQIQFWKNWCVWKLIQRLSKEDIKQPLEDYARQVTPWIRQGIITYLCERQNAGDRVLIVTASFEEAIAHLMHDHGFIVIGTRFFYDKTGFSEITLKPDCFSDGKVIRIHDWVRESGEDLIFSEAWSDALSDIPMMRLAEKQVWVCQKGKKEHFSDIFPNALFWND